jgi:hypothetical protein
MIFRPKKMLWILALLLVSCSSAPPKETKLAPPPDDKIYFGAFPDFGGSEDSVTSRKIRDFEAIAGTQIAYAMFSQNWFDGITYPKAHIHTIHDAGAIPCVRLMPRSDEEPGGIDETFTLQRIIDGDFDANLTRWAHDAKADGIALMIDFGVEMNGDWFPWSGVFNGGGTLDGYGDPRYPDGPERYRDAYRHIIELFRDAGVRHVTWVFHYNYATIPYEAWNKPHYYYPGDDYIDWVGFSLYGALTHDEEWEGLAFSAQLRDYADDFEAIETDNPIALFEFGVTDDHPEGDKSAWLEDAFDTILDNPYVHFSAISYWHENWQNEDESYSTLRLDSSSKVQATFRKRIAHPRFISESND